MGWLSSDKYYYLKDHLGSIRVVVDTVGEIVSYDDYDAWGMILNGRSSNFSFADDKYKFTGKERDVETGYDYFGARYFDSRIGRWNVVDPLFEKYPNVSPYNYALNNPVAYFDLNGADVYSIQLVATIGGKGLGGGASISWVWDDQGYSGLMLTFQFGGVGGALLKFGGGVTTYDAKSIYDLEGFGYSLGAGGSTGLFAFTTEHNSNFYSNYRSTANFNIGMGAGLGIWATFTHSQLFFSAKSKEFSAIVDYILKGGKISYESGYIVLLDEDDKPINKINLNLTASQKKLEKEFRFLENEATSQDNTKVHGNELLDYDASKN